MKRNEPCTHLRPDYSRLENAHYIWKDPDTGEVSWEPTGLEGELIRLGLLVPTACQPRDYCMADDPDT